MVQQATFNVDAVLVKVHNTKLSHRHVPRRQAVRKAKKKKETAYINECAAGISNKSACCHFSLAKVHKISKGDDTKQQHMVA